MRSARDEHGFTLIELLAALAIMALITGIGFPALQNQVTITQQVAARNEVLFALAQARGDALGTATPVRLAVNDDGALVATSTRPPLILPAGVSLVWPEGGFVFYPDGSANGGQAEIHAGTIISRLRVDPGTGRLETGE